MNFDVVFKRTIGFSYREAHASTMMSDGTSELGNVRALTAELRNFHSDRIRTCDLVLSMEVTDFYANRAS